MKNKDWKSDKAEGEMQEYEKKQMKKAAEKFKKKQADSTEKKAP